VVSITDFVVRTNHHSGADELVEGRPDETIILDPIEFLRAVMVWCEGDRSRSIACFLSETSQVGLDLLEVNTV
jgi:hypothetical protein